MKPKLLKLLIIIICTNLWLRATLWEINQDGTGNFTTIQEGIVAAVDADTVLVYPGLYFENVDFLSKSIILGSLYLTTGDEEYVSQTVINGNQTGSCVEVRDCIEDYTTLSGFTLTNGSGSQSSPTNLSIIGGGVMLRNSILAIIECVIYNNEAESGGGIHCHSSQLSLISVTIKHNKSNTYGGGIQAISSSYIIFSEDNLCSIYLNYSGKGCEIKKSSTCAPMEVIVDTFTVLYPDNYFIGSWDSQGNQVNDITMNIQHGMLQPIDSDLYVSTDGDNSNSGLTPDDPLATINYAYSLIQPDSIENNTIHLADGVYSSSLNDQWFPLQMRSYINLVGESMYNTILDAENDSSFITDKTSELNYTIRNLNIMNGYGVYNQGSGALWMLCFSDPQVRQKWVRLENLLIHDNEVAVRNLALWRINAYLKNVCFYNNFDDAVEIQSLSPFTSDDPITIELENCSIKDCHTGGITFFYGSPQFEKSHAILTNVEITDNLNPEFAVEQSCGLMIGDNWQVDMVNCTIGNNAISATQGGPIDLVGSSIELNIYNSILYDNYPRNIWSGNDIEEYPNVVNIYNSLVEDGEESCFSLYPWDEINFVENNLVGDTDPLWIDSGVYPYQLSTGSPCIDAGTLDLPAGIELPQYDLVGYPRIFGDTIDMGAYEWQGVGVEEPDIPQLSPLKTQISNYPNPFNPSTTIKLELAEAGKIELAIYNIKGQIVKTLIDADIAKGTFEINWNGKDEMGKPVSSGQYVVKLKQNGKETATKIMLLK